SGDALGNLAVSQDYTLVTQTAQDTSPPMDISDFRAEAGDEQIELSWVDPPDPDYQGVRIRYRTDGVFPINANDGNLVGDFAGSPVASGSHIHTGLTNGITYYYAAFAYDTSGNYSQTVFVQATPQFASSDNTGKQPPSFGCGTIKDISGGPGTGNGQVLLSLIIFALLFLLIKFHHRLGWRCVN
ncbi:MAG: hypothetical protein L0Y56_09885, partial [Nitrospira sp.]|nr:hypothetical protein [Nitrospira sp.]